MSVCAMRVCVIHGVRHATCSYCKCQRFKWKDINHLVTDLLLYDSSDSAARTRMQGTGAVIGRIACVCNEQKMTIRLFVVLSFSLSIALLIVHASTESHSIPHAKICTEMFIVGIFNCCRWIHYIETAEQILTPNWPSNMLKWKWNAQANKRQTYLIAKKLSFALNVSQYRKFDVLEVHCRFTRMYANQYT